MGTQYPIWVELIQKLAFIQQLTLHTTRINLVSGKKIRSTLLKVYFSSERTIFGHYVLGAGKDIQAFQQCNILHYDFLSVCWGYLTFIIILREYRMDTAQIIDLYIIVAFASLNKETGNNFDPEQYCNLSWCILGRSVYIFSDKGVICLKKITSTTDCLFIILITCRGVLAKLLNCLPGWYNQSILGTRQATQARCV